jgi:enoyl-CoA hydratase
MASDDHVLYSASDGIGLIRLNRPARHNALTRQMGRDLHHMFELLDRDEAVRAVVLIGEGPSFCSGQDLNEEDRSSSVNVLLREWEWDFQDRLAAMTKPTIVGLHGYVLGRGLLLSLAADIRVAGSGTVFGLPEAEFGKMPGGGGIQRLVALVGPGRATKMIMTSERIRAVDADSWGLVTDVVEDSEVQDACMARARSLLSRSPVAMAFAKRCIALACAASAESIAFEKALSALLWGGDAAGEASG